MLTTFTVDVEWLVRVMPRHVPFTLVRHWEHPDKASTTLNLLIRTKKGINYCPKVRRSYVKLTPLSLSHLYETHIKEGEVRISPQITVIHPPLTLVGSMR